MGNFKTILGNFKTKLGTFKTKLGNFKTKLTYINIKYIYIYIYIYSTINKHPILANGKQLLSDRNKHNSYENQQNTLYTLVKFQVNYRSPTII